MVDGTVVVAGLGQPAAGYPEDETDQYLYGVSKSDGTLQWSVPGVVSFAPVAAGDAIYARSRDDELLAIGSDGEVHDSVRLDEHSVVIGREFKTPAIAGGRLHLSLTEAIVAVE